MRAVRFALRHVLLDKVLHYTPEPIHGDTMRAHVLTFGFLIFVQQVLVQLDVGTSCSPDEPS